MLGARDRGRGDGERDIALAHTTASFTRAEKLERLDRYLRPPKPRSMFEKLQAMAARTGATVTIRQRGE